MINSQSKITDLEGKKLAVTTWFRSLRDQICAEFINIEREMNSSAEFNRKDWERADNGGGGQMSIMYGQVFEKVGVNISTVWGKLPDVLTTQMNIQAGSEFWATGISLVAHMKSPVVPTVHINTRMFTSGDRLWFGGGSDLTPTLEIDEDTAAFHGALKAACDKYNPEFYPKYKKECDNYFMIKHRNEARGVGGIFYDNLNTGNWDQDFNFTQDVGKAFLEIYPKLVRKNYNIAYTQDDKEKQLIKRGRYVEFNLVYDRGTHFGFLTGGNTEAILMSLPPLCAWR